MDAFEYIINRLGEIETACLSADSGSVTYSTHDVINLITNMRDSYNELQSVKPNLQLTCNQLATDCISRQKAIDAMCELMHHWFGGDPKDEIREIKRELEKLPSTESKQTVSNIIESLPTSPLLVGKMPSVQPESTANAEFWRKRADYYSDMCFKLIADMEAGVKIEAVKIDETGITFTKKKPPAHPDTIRCKDCKFYREYGCQRAFVYPEPEDFCSRAERRTDGRD